MRKAKEMKLPFPRQMLSDDIREPAGEADKAFMRVWNFLVSLGMRYASSFREMARDVWDELVRYRAREIGRLLGDKRRIREFDDNLANQVLDHGEVTPLGKLAVIFLTGTRATV